MISPPSDLLYITATRVAGILLLQFIQETDRNSGLYILLFTYDLLLILLLDPLSGIEDIGFKHTRPRILIYDLALLLILLI